MGLKNLLLAFNGGDASVAALRMALRLALHYDARLTGVVAHGASNITRSIPKWMDRDLQSQIEVLTYRRAEDLKTRFFETAKGQIEPEKLNWIDVAADPDSAITRFSRYFDLTVLGKYQSLTTAEEYELHPGRVAHDSGRPILLAPSGRLPESISDHAVVAWDGLRASSRALWDTVHLLDVKGKISVVTVGNDQDLVSNSGVEIVAQIAAHGKEADHIFLNRKKTVARSLLEFCKDVNADLLVAGAYQHSKLTEDLWGGVTADLLRETHLPLFLSH